MSNKKIELNVTINLDGYILLPDNMHPDVLLRFTRRKKRKKIVLKDTPREDLRSCYH